MMLLLEKFYLWMIKAGMPVVYAYVLFCSNIFLQTASEDAVGLENVANQVLVPIHYLFAGKIAKAETYELEQRFSYQEGFAWKTVGSIVALPASVLLGSALKGASYLFPDTRQRHNKILEACHSTVTQSNKDYYLSIGIPIENFADTEPLPPPQYQRRPGDENGLKEEKEALRQIAAIFNKNEIPFWVDCGTCLGAYRYGGAIPWDNDIDLAILAPDFQNAKHALNELDPEKYLVIDWSGRTRPNTFLVVCIKETGGRIDIGHFAIDEKQQQVTLILSNEENMFLPEIWKRVERRFVIPTPFSTIFPLKKVNFDGIEIPVPNQIEDYLKARYGNDLRPVKLFDPITQQYEKDLSHPYWKFLQ